MMESEGKMKNSVEKLSSDPIVENLTVFLKRIYYSETV